MRQTEEACNKNMVDKFKPYCINVINKIMMEWYNKFASGVMCVRRKPHIFGNECHKIFCGLTLILWRAHIVDGKDRLAQLGPNMHSELGRTVGLVIWMCKSLFSTGKYVVMDSVFVLQMGLLHLRRRERMLAISSRSASIGREFSRGSHPPIFCRKFGERCRHVGSCHRIQ